MTHTAKRTPAGAKHYLVVHTNTGRPIHVPGISGLALTQTLIENLHQAHGRGHMDLTMPAVGESSRVVIKLPKMKA